jgi:Glycosyl hydrolase catalytic core
MSKQRILITLVTLLLVAGAAALATRATASGSKQASRSMLVGVFDDPMTLGRPDRGFPLLKGLRAQVVRITLTWRSVATKRPKVATDPADPAYEWTVFDRAVLLAKKSRIQVLFGIQGTPAWANRGRSARIAPTNYRDLQNFARAAARRYSGTFERQDSETETTLLPAVRLWLAWNEPNNPAFLAPQYKRVHGRLMAWSAYQYARICNAVYIGIHGAGAGSERVACGATDPFGNNQPKSRRPSISPLAFLRSAKRYGLRRFDAWAHHPYAARPAETPATKPKAKTSVTLGNIGDLVSEVTRLYGGKPIWLTEYGYQTRPPDLFFGVTWKAQAKYLAQAYAIARNNRRIGMFVWFLIRDERALRGWQSGFFTASGARKPSYTAFRRLKH